jgi:DNA-directed RNA polymerase III subunit RPC8
MLKHASVRTDFFDEIWVPQRLLPEDSYLYVYPPLVHRGPYELTGNLSNHTDQIWIWVNDGQDFYYDSHETVRFRIESETWVDQSPLGPGEKEEGIERASPYAIEASMVDIGLGPCLWWD